MVCVIFRTAATARIDRLYRNWNSSIKKTVHNTPTSELSPRARFWAIHDFMFVDAKVAWSEPQEAILLMMLNSSCQLIFGNSWAQNADTIFRIFGWTMTRILTMAILGRRSGKSIAISCGTAAIFLYVPRVHIGLVSTKEDIGIMLFELIKSYFDLSGYDIKMDTTTKLKVQFGKYDIRHIIVLANNPETGKREICIFVAWCVTR